MKLVVVVQLLCKFGMFTFVVSYAMCFSVFYFPLLVKQTRFLDFWWENKKGEVFKGRWDEPSLNETMVQR